VNQNKGVRRKNLGILHDFKTFFIGKGSFYPTLRKARKIPVRNMHALMVLHLDSSQSCYKYWVYNALQGISWTNIILTDTDIKSVN
jgi:hypothetical protein